MIGGTGISLSVVNPNYATFSQLTAPLQSALVNWSKISPNGKKIAWVGDSTTLALAPSGSGGAAGVESYFTARYVTEPGSPLYGVTNVYFGANGNTLANFLANTPSSYGLSDVIAAAPNLIVFSYGINDIRLQASAPTLAAFTILLKRAVDALRAALPSTDIVLRTPNSWLTTDVSSLGYVVPNSPWATDGSALLRDAYRSLRDYWPNVVVYDSQAALFPETAPATFYYMNDQLHPTVGGYQRIYDHIARLITSDIVPADALLRTINSTALGTASNFYSRTIDRVASRAYAADDFNPGRAEAAAAGDYGEAHVTYPNVVYNGDYELITEGVWVTQGDGFLRFSGDLRANGKIDANDIVVQNGASAFTMTNGITATASAANIQLGSLGSGIPTYAQTAGMVQVWRHKYARMSAAKPYINTLTYTRQQRFKTTAAGNGFIRLAALNGEVNVQNFAWTTSDTIIHPTLGVVTLSGATFVPVSTNQVQVNKTGDWTFPTGYSVVVAAGVNANVAGLEPLKKRSSGTGLWDMIFANTENLTADRTVTVTVNDASKSVTLPVSGTLTTKASSGTSASDDITAASSNNSFVTFAQTYSIPASTINAGTVVRVRAMVRVTNASGTDTLTVEVRIGGTSLIATTAVDPSTTNDIHILDFEFTGRAAAGATASCVGSGTWTTNTNGTIANGTGLLTATNFATNGALTLDARAKWSSSTASTSARLETLNVRID